MLLAEGGCVADYDLDIVTNYKDVRGLSKEAPRKGLNNYFAGSYLMAIGLTYNTKEASEPTSFEDLLVPDLKVVSPCPRSTGSDRNSSTRSTVRLAVATITSIAACNSSLSSSKRITPSC